MVQSVHQLADDILHLPAGPGGMHAVLQGCSKILNFSVDKFMSKAAEMVDVLRHVSNCYCPWL